VYQKSWYSVLQILHSKGVNEITNLMRFFVNSVLVGVEWFVSVQFSPVFRMYRGIILSDNSHHCIIRRFRVTSGRVALAAIPFCPKPGSTRFSSVYCEEHHVSTHHTYRRCCKFFFTVSQTRVISNGMFFVSHWSLTF
jgi:hypothetical protein